MANHPVQVRGMSPKELAAEVSRLRYDALGEFLGALSENLKRDGKADTSKGKIKLGDYLTTASSDLSFAENEICKAWTCKSRTDTSKETKQQVKVGAVGVAA